MAESSPPKSGGGCFSKLMFLILLVAAGGMAAAMFHVVQPQDLSDLQPGKNPSAERDLKVVLRNSLDRGFAVTLSEAELNQWLGRTLVAKQGGLLNESVKFDRVWVRLNEGHAEVIMARTFFGKPFTVSMFVQIERMEGLKGVHTEISPNGGLFHPDLPKPRRGGRFGQLVVPEGFLHLALPSFRKLAAAYPEEIAMAFEQMARIQLEKGQITLDPREPLGAEGIPATF